jgi:hypothetical protein
MGFGGAQFQVVCAFAHGECLLRYFNSEDFVVGGWWLGITDRDGELVHTEFLALTSATPGTVRAWLEEFVGYELADALVSSAKSVIEAQQLEAAALAG